MEASPSSKRRKQAANVPLTGKSPTRQPEILMPHQNYSEVLTAVREETLMSSEGMEAYGDLLHGYAPPSYRPDLVFDTDLLRRYSVTNLAEAQKFVDLVQTMYSLGSEGFQEVINSLANGMHNTLRECASMRVQLETCRLETSSLWQKLTESNEAMIHLAAAEGVICKLKNELEKARADTEYVNELMQKMENETQDRDNKVISQLADENRVLDGQLKATQQKLAKAQQDAESGQGAARSLKQGLDLFQDPFSRTPYRFPVMQMNGHFMDLHKIISIWAKTPSESDNHPYRTYICPLTKTPTSLVQLKVTSRLQSHATALGLQLASPVQFEVYKDNQWAAFSPKNQYYLIAQVCFIYANMKLDRGLTDTIVLDEGSTFIHFQLSKVCTKCFFCPPHSAHRPRRRRNPCYTSRPRARWTASSPPCGCASMRPTAGIRSPTW